MPRSCEVLSVVLVQIVCFLGGRIRINFVAKLNQAYAHLIVMSPPPTPPYCFQFHVRMFIFCDGANVSGVILDYYILYYSFYISLISMECVYKTILTFNTKLRSFIWICYKDQNIKLKCFFKFCLNIFCHIGVKI